MSWCDKLASTPSMGFRLDAHYAPGEFILSALSPILDQWYQDDQPLFSIDRQESFGVTFTSQEGFQYGVEAAKIYVNFQHRLRARAVSAGLPVMEMLSRPLPYTRMVGEVADRLIEATLLVPKIEKRNVTRIGIISTTQVDTLDIPPGLLRFANYLGRPWGGGIRGFSLHIVTTLNKTPQWEDRCIHEIIRPEDSRQLWTIKLDWQRMYAQGKSTTRDNLEEICRTAQRASLEYFEDIAEGNRFDEEIISRPDGV